MIVWSCGKCLFLFLSFFLHNRLYNAVASVLFFKGLESLGAQFINHFTATNKSINTQLCGWITFFSIKLFSAEGAKDFCSRSFQQPQKSFEYKKHKFISISVALYFYIYLAFLSLGGKQSLVVCDALDNQTIIIIIEFWFKK